jgi:hypothetical protein
MSGEEKFRIDFNKGNNIVKHKPNPFRLSKYSLYAVIGGNIYFSYKTIIGKQPSYLMAMVIYDLLAYMSGVMFQL